MKPEINENRAENNNFEISKRQRTWQLQQSVIYPPGRHPELPPKPHESLQDG